ncbi:MAG: exonuclease SbcCD subunit D [Lachnospiraceae bacterium]|nr:exonuclease SbcCD subunit D [Lachnospiraceae bacterium]
MKLLHTSDWHLGITVRGASNYTQDQKYIIDEIFRIAQDEKVDGLIIAGDVFDKNVASSEAIRLYDEVITYISDKLNIPVFIIAGNHDGSDRLAQLRKLLVKSGVYIAGSLEKEPQIYSVGETDIFLLPWISTDKVKTVYTDDAEKIDSLESAYRVVLDKYRDKFVAGHKNIIVSHAFVSGAETSVSDTAAVVGKAAMISGSVFEGFDYVALGHIHGPQKVGDKIRYSGSPLVYSFGTEEKQTKSVVIYDTNTGEQKLVALKPFRKRITIKDTLENILKADYDEDILNGYVRIEVTDTYVGYDTASLFKDKYINYLEYSCPSIEAEEENITMSVEDLEEIKNDPNLVFKAYCEDVLGIAPSDRFKEMFENALSEFGGEVK